jgi:hypothetical protein
LSTVLDFRGDFQGPWHLVHVWQAWPKLVVYAFMAVFVSYCPLFWGYGGIYMAHDTQYMFERHDQKLAIFTFLGRFRELLSTVLGSRGDFQGPWHLVLIW